MNRKRINIEMELVSLLLGGEAHGREISKKTGLSLSSVQRALKDMEKRGAVDSRVCGRNRVYYMKRGIIAKKYAFDTENYKMLKLIAIYPFMGPLIENISRSCKCYIIILFGSFAKFSTTKESDIDIFAETDNLSEKRKMEDIDSRISVKIGKFSKDSMLAKEIIKNHVIIRGVEEYYERIGFFE